MDYDYLGSARNVRELQQLLRAVDPSATITLKCMDDNWSYVEVWVSKDGSDVVLK